VHRTLLGVAGGGLEWHACIYSTRAGLERVSIRGEGVADAAGQAGDELIPRRAEFTLTLIGSLGLRAGGDW